MSRIRLVPPPPLPFSNNRMERCMGGRSCNKYYCCEDSKIDRYLFSFTLFFIQADITPDFNCPSDISCNFIPDQSLHDPIQYKDAVLVFDRTSPSSVPNTQFLDDLALFLQQQWVGWSRDD